MLTVAKVRVTGGRDVWRLLLCGMRFLENSTLKDVKTFPEDLTATMIAKPALSGIYVNCPRGLSSKLRYLRFDGCLQTPRQRRYKSTPGKPLSANEVKNLLSTPTWSVSSLIEQQPDDTPAETITQKQLHHLLRLSALPLPETPQEEAKMIETLQSQLHFVRAVRNVDTTGIEPLYVIRDETEEGMQAMRFGLEDLKEELDKEEIVGFARRIRKKPETAIAQEGETVDILKLAPNKIGRYVVVNTKKT